MAMRINLLDWRQAQRDLRRKQFFAMLGAACGAGVVIVTLWMFGMQSAVAAQQARNAYLKQQIAEADQKIKEIEELDKVKRNLLARMRVIEELQASRSASVHFFDEVVNTLPEGISLTSIKQAGGRVLFEGVAESNGRISTYMKNLEASEWFDDPQLIVIRTDDKDKDRLRQGQFQLSVKNLTKPGDASDDDGGEEEE